MEKISSNCSSQHEFYEKNWEIKLYNNEFMPNRNNWIVAVESQQLDRNNWITAVVL